MEGYIEEVHKSVEWQEYQRPKNESCKRREGGKIERGGMEYVQASGWSDILAKQMAEIERERVEAEWREHDDSW